MQLRTWRLLNGSLDRDWVKWSLLFWATLGLKARLCKRLEIYFSWRQDIWMNGCWLNELRIIGHWKAWRLFKSWPVRPKIGRDPFGQRCFLDAFCGGKKKLENRKKSCKSHDSSLAKVNAKARHSLNWPTSSKLNTKIRPFAAESSKLLHNNYYFLKAQR